ncbi:hypothetical protein [Streptomyces sp. t39]|uniref:hypothetical protein n=1 Tax=Streptomyces sp. t39 TaxID=1828156 RepID=UPI0011CDB0DF|nr:hypothetical protein [Streptomyces sp. t39]
MGRDEAADTLREFTARWQRVLRDPSLGHRRTGLPAWTPLERGRHIRDMCLLFHFRLDAILGVPAHAPGRVTGRAGAPTAHPGTGDQHRDEQPRHVADDLGRAAEALARRLAGFTAHDWERGDPRLADPRLTVDFFTRHLLHDITHDLAEAADTDGAEAARRDDSGAVRRGTRRTGG